MYLILGYGRSGQATEYYLKKKGKQIIVYDDGIDLTPNIPWEYVEMLIQSPGISTSHPISTIAKEKNIPICTDINLFQKYNLNAHYIGITGTNGKSTTTALIGHILKSSGFCVAVGGNIGTPALSLPTYSENVWYVLELSSYQLEISDPISLDLAVWLNISPDHLERHKTMQKYIAAKQRIFLNAKQAIIGIDDNYSKNVANSLSIRAKKASTINNIKADLWVNEVGQLHIEKNIFDLTSLETLKGQHNWQNVAVAFLATLPIIKDVYQIFNTIKTFPGLPHRQQTVAKKENVVFINDSKATNANATEKALKTYWDQDIFLILGGQPKTDGIDLLKPYFPYIQKAYLIGEAQEKFAKELEGNLIYEKCHTLATAVKKAYADACHAQKPVVLLSPACASFDQFKDFQHRGEEFQKYVEQL